MAFEAWLSSECCQRTLTRKEQLEHRAVSLRQHGFLVFIRMSYIHSSTVPLYLVNKLT